MGVKLGRGISETLYGGGVWQNQMFTAIKLKIHQERLSLPFLINNKINQRNRSIWTIFLKQVCDEKLYRTILYFH